MSILVSIFKDFFRHAGNMPLAEMCNRIQSGFYANVINPLRNTLAQGDFLLAEKLKKSLPAFTLSAVYDKRRKDGCIVNYNGLIMLDIDKQEPNAIPDLAALAAELEGTIVTFRSPSGNGLKIGVRPFVDWALTLDRHRDTFNFVKELYESELGVAIDPSGKDKGRLCFVSNDPKLQFFPQRLEGFEGGTLILPPAPTIITPAAPAVAVAQPAQAPAQATAVSTSTPAGPPPVKAAEIFLKARKLVETRLPYQDGHRNDHVYQVAHRCKENGLTQEQTLYFARRDFTDLPEGVDSAVKSAYNSAPPAAAATLQSSGQGAKKRSFRTDVDGTQNWLKADFNGRYNVITERVELRKKGEEKYIPLTDRDVKSLWRRIMLAGINCYKNELYDIMESDFSEAYNPFEEYFYNLPEWDGVTDYIGQLAATVETTKQELWLRFFPKWLVAWVAGALLKSDKPNHVMLVFRSDKQGIGKTSWFQKIAPPELQKYVAEGVPDLKDKDSILLASQKYLIICDEIGQLNGSDQHRFKARMTQKVGTARAAYRRTAEDYPHRASYCGTTNDPQFIGDPQGSRRYLTFDVKEIDYKSEINYAGVFSQAMYLIGHGFVYWFTQKEIEELMEMNDEFRVMSAEEQLFFTHFEKPGEYAPGEWFSAADVMNVIAGRSSLNLNAYGVQRVGMLLHNNGFKKRISGGKTQYLAHLKTPEQVEAEKRNNHE